MAVNPQLTKEWIQFLKNNQIVSLKSDPTTGRLNYTRRVTTDDLARFLRDSAQFSEDQISDAIETAVAKKGASGEQPSAAQVVPEPEPTQVPVTGLSQTPGAIRKREQRAATKTASAAGTKAFSQMVRDLSKHDEPEEPEERTPKLHTKLKTPGSTGQKPRFTYKGLKEAFADATIDLDEKDIEKVFSILSSASVSQEPADDEESGQTTEPEEKKQSELRKIKRVIRDSMTNAQQRALWRLLNDATITEGFVSEPDVKEILQTASGLKPGAKGFFGLGKKKGVEFADLQSAWNKRGRPDDSRDIAIMLKADFGYDRKEINKVFRTVFDTRHGTYDTGVSPAVMKVAEYAKQHGYVEDLIKFLQDEFEFTESLDYDGKIVVEQLRTIFERIIHEERTALPALRRNFEQQNLGRHRK